MSFLSYLEDRRIHVFRVCRCHRLQRNSVLTPNRDFADLHTHNTRIHMPLVPSWRRFT